MERDRLGGDVPEAGRASYLVVDDEPAFCERLVGELERNGLQAFAATCADQALRLSKDRRPTRALVDMRLGEALDGFDVVRTLRGRDPDLRAVIITNYPSLEAFRAAVAAGAIDLFPKTVNVAEILHAFARPDRSWIDKRRIRLVPLTFEEAGWEHIATVVGMTGGDLALAARLLRLSRSTLYRKLDQIPAKFWTRECELAMELRRRELKMARQRPPAPCRRRGGGTRRLPPSVTPPSRPAD